jgi:tRNA pseudouridine38-40 synthase
MRNIKLVIEYDGTRYKGWQRQAENDLTIQGKIEDVLSKMSGETIEIIGSGRTDGGVHAIGQVANFRIRSEMKIEDIIDYCYRYLPEDIVVKSGEMVSENFHSRYNAISKTYLYRIWYNKRHDVFNRKYCYHIDKQLDVDSMRNAASYLIGKHDFRSFTSLKSKKKSTVREIYNISIIHSQSNLDIEIKGNGFLQNMVRIIIGTLIEIGLGNLGAEEIKKILDNKDRGYAGPTAPARGLFLKEVQY